MKKIEVNFGGGRDTILWCLYSDIVLSYELDGDALHALYGGKRYYTSLSGLSGAGYLAPDTGKWDGIKFGYYRTDATREQHREIVGTSGAGLPIFGYAPIRSHEGIDGDYPFVLTDGGTVAFVSQCQLKETLAGWGGLDTRDIEITNFSVDGDYQTIKFRLYNPYKFKGVRATRFVDLREIRKRNAEYVSMSFMEDTLHIVREGNRWYHRNIDGYFDTRWDDDPRTISGEVVEGWVGDGSGFFWKRYGLDVRSFIERRRDSISGGRYATTDIKEYIEYERNFSALEWFSSSPDKFREELEKALLKKARIEFVHSSSSLRRPQKIRELMELHKGTTVRLQDALDAGYCEPGCTRFIKKYGISMHEGCCTIDSLLNNISIDKMLDDPAFRSVMMSCLE